ncbi:MAG: T9SS type B sorting domain-containing protein [Bacteroidota bacterium]
MKKLTLLLALWVTLVASGQDCTTMVAPGNGATNVAVDATITWQAIPGVPSYRIILGSSSGADDIADTTVGSATSYNAPLGLPENTTIYVTIILDFFTGQADVFCPVGSFTTEDVTTPPNCTTMTTPGNGASDVSVFTNIAWNHAPTATSYDLLVGTAAGLGDIADENVAALSFNPPGAMPEDTLIFVTIIPRNENGPATNCTDFSFRTRELAPIPECTSLTQPVDGATNVPLTPTLEWDAVAGAEGYRVTIGTTPTNSDVLDQAVFNTNSTRVIDFEANRTFYIRIVPFNESGDALDCDQQSFSTQLGCGPYIDPDTGVLTTINPVIEFPSTFTLCDEEGSLTIEAPQGTDGYRWYRLDAQGNQIFLAENKALEVNRATDYLLEVYNEVPQEGADPIECPTQVRFEVRSSKAPVVEALIPRDTPFGLEITVAVLGTGDYEYALNPNGPYQENNRFEGLPRADITIYIRDRNGCGITKTTLEQDLTVDGFPAFFTPNGDGINDHWQFIRPESGEDMPWRVIEVYDRYGMLMMQIDPWGIGWDGTSNGRPVPEGGYWFSALTDKGEKVKGNFSLKR